MKSFLALLIVSVVACMAAEPAPQLVRASGTAVVTVKPDLATITIGVVSQGTTADAASQSNARQVTAVLNQLKSDLGAKAEIRTLGYSLSPMYKSSNNSAPVISGYTASNTVIVKLEDLDRVGTVIDSATKTGANNIHGISFSLKNENTVRSQALAKAAQTARVNAEAIASALALRVVRVHSAETSDAAPVMPLQAQFRAMAADARMPAPVEGGTIDVSATVTIALEVAQQ